MLRQIKHTPVADPLKISDINSPDPFREGLEYNAPARGVWNIVHTGMLIPEAHQVYVCAQGCLRGVVLTAAEMNAMERMSWVSLREEDMWNGEMENRVVEGVAHILDQMEKKPPCVLVYLSCMHMFEGCDFTVILNELSEQFPGTDFVNCYMIPTMRKSMSPDAMMKVSLYTPVKKLPVDNDLIGLIGCDRRTDPTSDLFTLIHAAGKRIWEINDAVSYNEYLQLGSASMLISYLPTSAAAGRQLSKKLGIEWHEYPLCYDEDEIMTCLRDLSHRLGLKEADSEKIIEQNRERAADEIKLALDTVGDIPVAIDFTAVPRPFGLAMFLAENGFNVKRIYADHITKPDLKAFEILKEKYPDTLVYPTVSPEMRFAADKNENCDYLCIGQKAAYFTGSRRFVNIADGGGMYGFDGIARMAQQISDSYLRPKDIKLTISLKGIGCESCLI